MFHKTKSTQFHNKRDLRASGLSLLPLALRPCLLLSRKISDFFQISNSFKLLSLLLVIFCFSFFLQNSYTYNVSAKSVTLTIPSNALSLEVSPNSGTVFKKSNAGTISVATDSSYGYSLSIYSKNSNTDSIKSNDLINGSNKISSIVSALNEEDYENSGDTDKNTWAYLPSKLNGSVNTDFQPGPTNEPTTLDTTDSSSLGTDYNITLATKIDNTLPAGNYSNTFVLTATTNDPAYDDIMQNWTGCEDLPKETKTLNLLDTRDNKVYTVARLKDGKCWMTENLAIENRTLTTEDSDVKDTVILPASTDKPNVSNSYTSYELHVDPEYGGYYSWYAATAGEGTTSVSTYGTNVDYSICPKGWRLPTKQDFIDLDIALGGTGQSRSSYSDYILPREYQGEPNYFKMGGYYRSGSANFIGSNAYYWSSTINYARSAHILNFDSNSLNPQNSGDKEYLFSVRCISRSMDPTMQNVEKWGDSVKSGETKTVPDIRDDKQYTVSRLADNKLWMTQNLTIEDKILTTNDSDVGEDFTLPASTNKPNANNSYTSTDLHVDATYGGYYTWYTATAGEGTQDISIDGQNVEHSICPKGWRLPTKQEFIDLDKALGGTGENNQNSSTLINTYKDPSTNNFLMGGFYSSGSNDFRGGNYAYYWSSSVYNSYNAYTLYFASSRVYPQNGNNKYRLSYIRCVSRTDDPKEVGTMQTVDEWGDSVEQGEIVISKDTRDNNEYTVARLADNKLWMTKNLEIEDKTLTKTDSDVNTDVTLPASTDRPNASNSYTSYELHVDSEYGGYYTWYAATAGQGTQSVSTDDTNVNYSICPKGWRLPTRDEYAALTNAYSIGNNAAGATKLQADTLNFKMGGFYTSGSINDKGSNAYYWSSTANDAYNAYYLTFNSSNVNPQNNYVKINLFSVRCVSRTDDPKEVGTLQTVDEWGDSVKQGKTVISKDTRDNKEYTVARLADNKLWMTKNLEIENKTLTTDDSDVKNNITLPTSTDSPNANNSYTSNELHVSATYGGYYTWYTATAGEGTQSFSTNGDNVDYSICPKGWRLPTIGEYAAMTNAYAYIIGNNAALITKLQSEPLNFKKGGLYFSGSSTNSGSYAYYWSSTTYNSNTVYNLNLGASSVTTIQTNQGKYALASVRCISRE